MPNVVWHWQHFPGPFGMPFTGHGSGGCGGNTQHQQDYPAVSCGLVRVRLVGKGYGMGLGKDKVRR